MLIGKLYLHLPSDVIAAPKHELAPQNWEELWRDLSFDINGNRCMVMVEPLNPADRETFDAAAAEKELWDLAEKETIISITSYRVGNDIAEPLDDYPGGILHIQEYKPYPLHIQDRYWVAPNGKRHMATA